MNESSVLYNKYRPARFEDVVAQDDITRILKNQVAGDSVAHSYVFTGAAGTGKTTCARILAKAINCLNPAGGDPCLVCENCAMIDSGSTDVTEIDAASNNSVGDMRDLRDTLEYLPTELRKRVFIIDEAHMLSNAAWAALLKTIEEPPAHVVFILATTETQKIPATIMSRCMQFTFKRIGMQNCADFLNKIASKENLTLEPDAALILARAANGGLRDALRLLETVANKDKITAEIVTNAIGAAGTVHLFEISDAVSARDSETALAVLDRLFRDSKDMKQLASGLLRHYRDMLVMKIAPNSGFLCDLLPDETERYRRSAGLCETAALLGALDILGETYDRMYRAGGGGDRTLLELALLKLCVPVKSPIIAPIPRQELPAKPIAPVPENKAIIPHHKAVSADQIEARLPPYLLASLAGARWDFSRGEGVAVLFGSSVTISALANANNRAEIETALRNFGYEKLIVEPETADLPKPVTDKRRVDIFLEQAAAQGITVRQK